jgi:hypothetical protein
MAPRQRGPPNRNEPGQTEKTLLHPRGATEQGGRPPQLVAPRWCSKAVYVPMREARLRPLSVIICGLRRIRGSCCSGTSSSVRSYYRTRIGPSVTGRVRSSSSCVRVWRVAATTPVRSRTTGQDCRMGPPSLEGWMSRQSPGATTSCLEAGCAGVEADCAERRAYRRQSARVGVV